MTLRVGRARPHRLAAAVREGLIKFVPLRVRTQLRQENLIAIRVDQISIRRRRQDRARSLRSFVSIADA